MQLEKSYDPKKVEERWYSYWEREGLFRAEPSSPKPAYSIVIPPPNVTGQLHMGHALNNTLQDILCRYKRMCGYEVLWMPGTDHAGIATQNVVERELARQGLTRHELGREKFIQRVWEWKEHYGNRIVEQLKRLGASCDWSRLRFTMDEGLSRAVREVFVRLYEEGLIYRGDYIINWCPRCHTALSDLETEHKDVEGALYYIRYPFDGAEGHLVVATTRPETMLGDTAVAINPEDPRYQNLPASHLLLPLVGRRLPIIREGYVSTEFGTGVLKVTPAHDPNDFLIGQRHGLEAIRIMDDEARINELGGPYKGLDRFEARRRIVQDLKAQGLLEKIEPHTHAVGHCYRCGTMVEPILSKQWFVRVGPLAEQALKAVEDRRTRIIPEVWTKTYFEWLRGIRDWCISRQIWWGHRIPAWYCPEGHVTVSRTTPVRCSVCSSTSLTQDSDVLDTWFSSALWPFSTMGWPDDTPELRRFYPTSCLVTAFDILFFWVARMMMMGLKFMGDVPFKDVYIHALVRDEHGQKMSKSKGNVIDPLEMMERFGTDALRFTLTALAAQGRDIRLSTERIEGYRHFVNKIWNAARLVLMNLSAGAIGTVDRQQMLLEERWILSRVNRLAHTVTTALDEYKFNEAASALYQFTWHEFCDWFLEMAKAPLYDDTNPARQQATRGLLAEVFGRLLRLLHPFMPFVTEELWQRLPTTTGSILRAPWPECAESELDEEAEAQMELIKELISSVRNIRAEVGLGPGKPVPVVLVPHARWVEELVHAQQGNITRLAKVSELTIDPNASAPPTSAAAALTDLTLYVPLGGLVDLRAEAARLKKEISKLEKQLATSQRKLANPEFLSKAPAHVVDKERKRLEQTQGRLERLRHNLERVEEIS